VNIENIKYVRWRFINKLERQKFKIFREYLMKIKGQRVHEREKNYFAEKKIRNTAVCLYF